MNCSITEELDALLTTVLLWAGITSGGRLAFRMRVRVCDGGWCDTNVQI